MVHKYWERIKALTAPPAQVEKLQLTNGEIIHWSVDQIGSDFYLNVWEGSHFWMAPPRKTWKEVEADLKAFVYSHSGIEDAKRL